MYPHSKNNKEVTNGSEISTTTTHHLLHPQQQQMQQKYSQQQQQQQQQHQIQSQGLKIDKFLPSSNSQNYHNSNSNVSVLPSVTNSPLLINTTTGTVISPSSSSLISSSGLPLPISSVANSQINNQQQQQQQQQIITPIMHHHVNNPFTNGGSGGGGSSTQSSRTASPQFNSSINNRNLITNNNIISKNYLPPSSLSSSSNNFNFNQHQQSPSISSSSVVTSTNSITSSSSNSSSMPVKLTNPNQNISNLNDSMKNLSIEKNEITDTNNVNGYQNVFPISSRITHIPSVYQNENFKISPLNNQPQQQQQQQPPPQPQQQQHQSQNLIDNYPYFKNSLSSVNDNRIELSSPPSMSENQYVPTVNKIYDQHNMADSQKLQIPSSMPTVGNYENKNVLDHLPSSASSTILPSLSRNENNYFNNNQISTAVSSSLPPPPLPQSTAGSITDHQQKQQQQQQQQQQQKHQDKIPRNPNIALASRSYKPIVTSYQGVQKPVYSPSTAFQQQQQYIQNQHQQQHQQQQQQQQYAQQRNVQPQPHPSASSVPTFAGHPNVESLKYTSSPPISSSSPSYDYTSNVTKQGFNKLWGQDVIDLMQHRHILPHDKFQPPRIVLNNQFYESINCNPDIMRCTLNKIPESNNLLQKSRLPLGILVHPFRDINSLPVIQCPNIVRCRLCRAYINPFVYFIDSKMWKCNLCYRVNELPEDFQYDPATHTYGDVTRRPEVRSSTIEFIAPSEYMLRPPQPAIYLFMFDVSILAQQSGYLEIACSTILKYIDDMPGDARTRVGFIAFNSEIHFYNIAEGYSQPHELTLVDIDDPFLPRPDNLLVNLKENRELIKDLLNQLPTRFEHSHDSGSALGAVLQVAYKLMCATGGRVTVFQTCLPNKGPGLLQPREDPNNRSSKDVMHLSPATDFYKRHALECSGYQIAVDLFVLNQQYCDLATISGVSKYSGGSIYHFPLYQKTKPQNVDALKHCLKRYLTRKIGFEAVMRIRCTRGLQVHTFHGNFFVRSTDLLSLPNVNPDAGYGMQISYEESLTDIKTICFQSALLYTNSEGERRIRVHTLCLPVSSSLHEVMYSSDSQAIVSLLSKMAVDRCMSSSITDARDAFINATIDIINAFKVAQNLPQGQNGQLLISKNLSLLPLYISALLKHIAFRIGTSTRLDDRIAAMDSMKTLPLDQLMKTIYPEFYLIDTLFSNYDNNDLNEITNNNLIDNQNYPPLLQLSAEFLDSRSMFLMDCGPLIMIYVGLNVPTNILENVLGVHSTSEIPDYCYGLQLLNTPENKLLRKFIDILNEEKPFLPTIQIIRDTSTCRNLLAEKLVDDRSESSLSYYEFLQHLRSQIK